MKDLERPSANAKAFFGKSMPKPPVGNKFVSKEKKTLHSSMNIRLRFPEGSVEYNEFMKVMKRVSDPELLERCVDNKTQNMNESFHSKVWHMCPKASHFESDQMEFAICQNILIHNKGYEHGSILRFLGINITKPIKSLWSVQEQSRVKLRPFKGKQRYKRQSWNSKAGQEDFDDDGLLSENDESVSYKSRAF